MENFDKRKNYYIILDTETSNAQFNGERIDLKFSLPYDISFVICDKQGKIYRKFFFVIAEYYFDTDLMRSAYYYSKLPFYEKEIKEGKAIVATSLEVKQFLRYLCDKYHIKAICAYNARFDYDATNNAIRVYSGSAFRYFFPYGIPVFDIMKMVNDTIVKQKAYRQFCLENGYLTKHNTPRVKASAEVVYRYITNNTNFIESHTGLDDAMIETVIFAHCLKQHKKMRKELWKKE